VRLQSAAVGFDQALEGGWIAPAGGVKIGGGTGFSNWIHEL
jgi:hypothetical protein